MAPPRKPFVCDCGEPGVKRNNCREVLCARCLVFEAQRASKYARGDKPPAEKTLCGVKHQKKCTFVEMFDSTPIIYPETISRLERLLEVVQLNPGVISISEDKCAQAV